MRIQKGCCHYYRHSYMLLTMCFFLGLVFVLDRRDKKSKIALFDGTNEIRSFSPCWQLLCHRIQSAVDCRCIMLWIWKKKNKIDEEMGRFRNGIEEYDVASFRSRSIRANYQLQYLL
jgi:hypothetical protein